MIAGMNLWPVVVVLLVGITLGVLVWAWPWLDPASPLRVAERITAAANAWAAVRDARALVRLQRGGESPIDATIFYLAPTSVRLEVQSPSALQGHMYAFRTVPEEQLLIHHRPDMNLAIELRFPPNTFSLEVPSPGEVQAALRQGRLSLARLDQDTFAVRGFPPGTAETVLQLDPTTNLPTRIVVRENWEVPPLEVRIVELRTNLGLELRDLFTLDPLPDRWLFLRDRIDAAGTP